MSSQNDETSNLLHDSSEPRFHQANRWTFLRLGATLLWGGFLTAVDESFVLAQNGKIASKFSQFRNSSLLIIVYAIVNTICNPLVCNDSAPNFVYSEIAHTPTKLGKLAQKGRKLQVVIATGSIFGLGNVFCALSSSWPLLVACRGIVGLGGAGLGLMATILWSDTQPLGNLAVWQSYSVVSETLGWVVGGPLGELTTEKSSWRLMFAMQASLIAPALALVLFPHLCRWPARLEKTHLADAGPRHKSEGCKFDIVGAILCVFVFLPPFIALSIGGEVIPWRHPAIFGLLAVSAPAVAIFILWELQTTSEPIIPIRLLFGVNLSRPLVCLVLFMVAHNSVLFLLPLYAQVEYFGLGKSHGIVVSVFMISMTVGAVAGARFVKRYGPKLPLILALSSLSTCYWVLSQGLTRPNHWTFLPTIGLIGFFAGTPPNCLLVCIVWFSPPEDQAVVISMFQVFESFGGLVAIAITSASLRLVTISKLREHFGTDTNSEQMFERFLENVDYLSSVPVDVQAAMQAAYGEAVRRCCFFAVVSCIASVVVATVLPRLSFYESQINEDLMEDSESNDDSHRFRDGVAVCMRPLNAIWRDHSLARTDL